MVIIHTCQLHLWSVLTNDNTEISIISILRIPFVAFRFKPLLRWFLGRVCFNVKPVIPFQAVWGPTSSISWFRCCWLAMTHAEQAQILGSGSLLLVRRSCSGEAAFCSAWGICTHLAMKRSFELSCHSRSMVSNFASVCILCSSKSSNTLVYTFHNPCFFVLSTYEAVYYWIGYTYYTPHPFRDWTIKFVSSLTVMSSVRSFLPRRNTRAPLVALAYLDGAENSTARQMSCWTLVPTLDW